MERFGNIDTMQVLLVVILLLCGYFFLFQAVAKRAASRSSIPLLAIVLLLVYLLVSLPLVLIISPFSSLSDDDKLCHRFLAPRARADGHPAEI